jgi:transposase-like protein
MGRPRTPVDVDRIRDLLAQRYSVVEVAIEMGLSPTTILRQARKAGIPTPPKGPRPGLRQLPVDLAEAQRLLDRGLLMEEVAAALGVSPNTLLRRRNAAGIPHLTRGAKAMERNYFWRGGRIVDKHGYILIKTPGHPFATKSGYVREHRLVMERVLGRYLEPEEVVHHRNGVNDDNRPENLRLYADNASHLADELTGRRRS